MLEWTLFFLISFTSLVLILLYYIINFKYENFDMYYLSLLVLPLIFLYSLNTLVPTSFFIRGVEFWNFAILSIVISFFVYLVIDYLFSNSDINKFKNIKSLNLTIFRNISFNLKPKALVVFVLLLVMIFYPNLINYNYNNNVDSPFYAYEHNEQGYGSITGGFVYNGDNLSEHHGRYIFSDYVFGDIRSLNLSDRTDLRVVSPSSTSLVPPNLKVTTFASDANNELYFADVNNGIFMINEDSSGNIVFIDQFPNNSFKRPVGLSKVGDSFFIAEHAGSVKKASLTSNEVSLVLNITHKVEYDGWERGLLGIAVSPHFKDDNTFFLSYTMKDNGTLCISSFELRENANQTLSSERQILFVDQESAAHNGGHILFGPDNLFYVGLGDGGQQESVDYYNNNNAQNLENLKGSLIRINVFPESTDSAYTIPKDNPFFGNDQGIREEIYAYGFRNPWKFSFDSSTGSILLGDVGEASFEEINIVQKGKNYGWNAFEGFDCYRTSKYEEIFCQVDRNADINTTLVLGISSFLPLAIFYNIFRGGRLEYKSVIILAFTQIFLFIFWYYMNYVTGEWRSAEVKDIALPFFGIYLGFFIGLGFILINEIRYLSVKND